MENSNHTPFSYQDELTPSLKWYGLSVLVLVGGITFLYFHIMNGFDRLGGAFDQIKTPGTVEMVAGRTGEHGIYLETATLYDGKPFTAEEEEGKDLSIAVTRKEDGSAVPLVDVNGNVRYSYFGRDGVSLWMFEAKELETYEITVDRSTREGKPLIVAVSGLNPAFEMARLLNDGFQIFLMIGGVSIALWVTVFILRKKDKEKRHWSDRGKGGAGKPVAPEPVASKAETPDGEADYDLRPNGKRKKRKK